MTTRMSPNQSRMVMDEVNQLSLCLLLSHEQAALIRSLYLLPTA